MPPPAPDAVLPVLPRHLVDKRRLSSAEDRELSAERSAWFRAQGIDPGNWSKTYPILLASWKVHGVASAMDRARERRARD